MHMLEMLFGDLNQLHSYGTLFQDNLSGEDLWSQTTDTKWKNTGDLEQLWCLTQKFYKEVTRTISLTVRLLEPGHLEEI